ncbi:ATP-dependent DNA helicase Q-like 3 [Dendronephthya gigantea]|uniref:ATP-dependent DNA helicase Q-like 3 n=1 Tax=Dendronephthya gigantea TaxID=151771 RepID=UPI00106D1970|nr:ATP-dependent DNA helicase Q-like 3 [Dendronephthya gigantea]
MASLVQENHKELMSKIRAIDPYLKKEQEQAVEKLLLGEDVLAILPTGFGKSRIFQTYSRVKDNEMNGCSVVLVIAPLSSIIDDQITVLHSSGYSAADVKCLQQEDLERCDFKVLFGSAENVLTTKFQNLLLDRQSDLHKRVCCIVVDEAHTVETWTGKR